MQVFVRDTNGKTFTAIVKATDKVERLAAYVHYKTNLPFHRMRLVCNGRILGWDATLVEAGVVKESTIHVQIRLGSAHGCPCCGPQPEIRADNE